MAPRISANDYMKQQLFNNVGVLFYNLDAKSLENLQSASDFSKSSFNNEEMNQIVREELGDDTFKKFKLGTQVIGLTAQDIQINRVLEQDIDKAAEYAIDIDNISKELADLEDEENEIFSNNMDRYTELSKKGDKGNLSESEKSEMNEIARLIFNDNCGGIQDKKNDVSNKLSSASNKLTSLNIKTHIAIASDYSEKTDSACSEIKKLLDVDSFGITDDVVATLNGSIQEISKYADVK